MQDVANPFIGSNRAPEGSGCVPFSSSRSLQCDIGENFVASRKFTTLVNKVLPKWSCCKMFNYGLSTQLTVPFGRFICFKGILYSF